MANPFRRISLRRSATALLIAFGLSMTVALWSGRQRSARATQRLDSAAQRLDSITDVAPADNPRRAAIAWGYAERLRLGLESPFKLVESSARDPRLTLDERHLVSWALLSRVLRGETHEIDPAALDGLGPATAQGVTNGEQHLDLIQGLIVPAENPRAAELAVRLGYSLAAAERIVDAGAPTVAAEAAALIADREIARREAAQVVRAANGADPIHVVARRRARHGFYVERPALFAPNDQIEREAIALAASLLESLRALAPARLMDSAHVLDDNVVAIAPRLYAAGAFALPSAPLTVTARRYLSLVGTQVSRLDLDALARARNAEMLVAVTRLQEPTRHERRVLGRMLLSAGVAMRSLAQQTVWFPGDSAPSPRQLAEALTFADISFDASVPTPWRGFYLIALRDAVADLRKVLPSAHLEGLRVRFRMSAPADSALAMHDPRTRTLHLPVISAGGTLTHELAHDLDRQSAQRLGVAGYRSDIVARVASARRGGVNSKLAASLRALTEEPVDAARAAPADRPAEIFATRVDWFVAAALARIGRSNGFLSAAQDEMLTGHVVHPQRLRNASASRPLVTALEEMTSIAPFAADEETPSLTVLLRWALQSPVDRRAAGDIMRNRSPVWAPTVLTTAAGEPCHLPQGSRAQLVRMAAESRARGWLRARARATADSVRPGWARSMLGQVPWEQSAADQRVTRLRGQILESLTTGAPLASGFAAYAVPMAERARCGGA